MAEIKSRVVNVLSTTLGVDEEHLATVDDFTDIANWDSLNHLYVMLGIEKEFGVKFDIQEMANTSSISIVSELLKRKLG